MAILQNQILIRFEMFLISVCCLNMPRKKKNEEVKPMGPTRTRIEVGIEKLDKLKNSFMFILEKFSKAIQANISNINSLTFLWLSNITNKRQYTINSICRWRFFKRSRDNSRCKRNLLFRYNTLSFGLILEINDSMTNRWLVKTIRKAIKTSQWTFTHFCRLFYSFQVFKCNSNVCYLESRDSWWFYSNVRKICERRLCPRKSWKKEFWQNLHRAWLCQQQIKSRTS